MFCRNFCFCMLCHETMENNADVEPNDVCGQADVSADLGIVMAGASMNDDKSDDDGQDPNDLLGRNVFPE